MKCAALVISHPDIPADKIELAMGIIRLWRNSTKYIYEMLPKIRRRWWGHGYRVQLEIMALNEALPKAYQRDSLVRSK